VEKVVHLNEVFKTIFYSKVLELRKGIFLGGQSLKQIEII
jgi:hypothetical protein